MAQLAELGAVMCNAEHVAGIACLLLFYLAMLLCSPNGVVPYKHATASAKYRTLHSSFVPSPTSSCVAVHPAAFSLAFFHKHALSS